MNAGKMKVVYIIAIAVVALFVLSNAIFGFPFSQAKKVNIPFNPPDNLGTVKTIVRSTDGGYFVGCNNFGVVKLKKDWSLDTSFRTPPMVSPAKSITVNPDGSIIAVGLMHFLNKNVNLGNYEDDPSPTYIAKFTSTGKLDTSFRAPQLGEATTVLALANGQYMVAGNVLKIDGSLSKQTSGGETSLSRQPQYIPNVDGTPYFIKLNSNGTQDVTWATPGDLQGTITSAIHTKDDEFVVSGYFHLPVNTGKYTGTPMLRAKSSTPNEPTTILLKFNTDGTYDKNFVLPSNVIAVEGAYEVQEIGNYLVTIGAFRVPSAGNYPANILRFGSDGTLDHNFLPSADDIDGLYASPMYAMSLTKDLYTLGGKGSILQVNSAGKDVSKDSGFVLIASNSNIYTMLPVGENNFVLGGEFAISPTNLILARE